MKTTLDLPDDVILAVKLRAVMQQRPLKDLVADFLRQGLGIFPSVQSEPPPISTLVEIGVNGLPVIRCRTGAPATLSKLEDLLKLEQLAHAQEDLSHVGIVV